MSVPFVDRGALRNAPMTGGRALVELLKLHGVRRIFTVPGESFLAVLDALVDEPEIEVITCRNEGGAAMMAEAYGKLTGQPGICFVTRGPGATNASCGVHVAFQDSTPMILFIGQVERGALGREAFQEVEFREMYRPLAKWVVQIDEGDRLAELLGRAFQTTVAGRPGPVVVALPEDLLSEPAMPPKSRSHNVIEPGIRRQDGRQLVEQLCSAERPLVILGGGGWDRDGYDAIREFSEQWKIPIAVSLRCHGLFDNSHANYVGDIGIAPAAKLIAAVKSSDLLLVIGARLGEVTTSGYSLIEIPVPQQNLVHVYPAAEELGRVYQPTLGINAGVNECAKFLAAQKPQCAGWRDHTERLRQAYLDATEPPETPGAVQMGSIMRWLRERLPADAIVSNGAGNYAIWPNKYYSYRGFRTMLAPTSGSMGYGLPAAVSAKLELPNRVVVCFAGDGCLMMSIQELATAVQQNAAVIVLVINNGMLGTIRTHQERSFPTRVIATDLVNPDFEAVAKGFGAFAETVRRTEEFAPAFERALASGKVALLNLMVDREALTPTMSLSALTSASLSAASGR